MNLPLLIAHRGASGYAPENTLAAIRMAMDLGVDGIEIDVQLAADNVAVVVHDETVMRYVRRKDKVSELTSEELNRIDVGSWFNRRYRGRARPEYSKERVPTLSTALRLLEDFDGRIYIELKCNDATFRRLSAAVCDLIRKFPRPGGVIIKSFKLAVIPEIRHRLPSTATAALFAPEVVHFLRRREHIIALAREFGADQISVHHSLVTPRLASLAADAKMPLVVWTVDDPRWLLRRRSLRIYGLITNHPERFFPSATTTRSSEELS